MSRPWHAISTDEALSALNSRESGLTQSEVESLQATYGPNRLEGGKKTPALLLLLRQFLSPLIYVLLGAAIASLLVAKYVDAIVIFSVLLLNAVIGFTQEQQAAKTMEALVKMTAPKARVRRDGTVRVIDVEEIVPGDILLLESGNRVSADARVIEEANLKVVEASLTGESTSVDKETYALPEDASVAERENMVFMGTVVTHGRATAVVVETGMDTQIGAIAGALRQVEEEPTPVEKSIRKLSRYIIILVLSFVAVLAVIGLHRGLEPIDVLFLAVAASVSAIPEGLPATVTVVLAIGMRFMAKRNAIIRRLVAVETLGSATVICSDKTGTLTMNEMTVRRIYADGEFVDVTGEGYGTEGEFRKDGVNLAASDNETLRLLLLTGTLCNDAELVKRDGNLEPVGDPTELALVVAAAKAGIDKGHEQSQLGRTCEIPFESEQQFMAVGYQGAEYTRVYVKGSVERLLGMSGSVLRTGTSYPLDEIEAGRIHQATDNLASDALRVIALGYMDLTTSPHKLKCGQIEGELTFLGLAGMADPPREEARRAVEECRQAGIRVVMITGDHRTTAESIGRQLDLPPGKTIEGRELQAMTDDELTGQIDGISVFARIDPLQKLRIVDALKSKGQVVAMTGDGVNDAPALKAANIGIAMGINGTDVAKESADMVLADDNFSSIVAAVEEGRAIFSRLRNVLFFLLSTGVGELIALTISVAVLGKAPLLAVQIIWVNLVTATPSAIPLGLEPKFGDELRQPPRNPQVGLVFPGNILRVASMATIMGLGVFFVFRWADSTMSIEKARTMAFCTMVAFEWFNAFSARSDTHRVWDLGPLKNRYLVGGIGLAVLLQMAAVYLPAGQAAFQTVPLSPTEWLIPIACGALLLSAEEIRKHLAPDLFSLGKWQPGVRPNTRRLKSSR